MPALSVVFDTNAYRELGTERFQRLRDRERQQGVCAYGAFHPMLELVAGSVEEDASKARISAASAKRLFQHCTEYTGDKPKIRFIAASSSQAAFDLFGVRSKEVEATVEVLPLMVGWLALHADEGWGAHRTLAESLRDWRDRAETEFADMLFRNIVKKLQPQAESWFDVTRPSPTRTELLERARRGEGKPLIARSVATRAARRAGIPPESVNLERFAAEAERRYPVPIAILDRVIIDLIERGVDMSKPSRANSRWDYEVAFSIGHQTKIADCPAWLVSTDRLVLDSAASTPCTNVLSLSEYERVLAMPYDEFRERVESAARAC